MQNFLDKFLLFWKELPNNIGPFWGSLVTFVQNLTGLSHQTAQIVLVVVLGWLVVNLVLRKVHRGLVKLQRKRVQQCIYEYDRIWYLEAKAMYKFNQKMKQQGQVNHLAHGTRSVLTLDKKDYLVNRQKIMRDLQKLEKYLGQKIVPDSIIKKINLLHIRIAGSGAVQHLLGWILVVLTLGLYALGWERVYYR